MSAAPPNSQDAHPGDATEGPREHHRAILLIHGVGSQTKGQFFDEAFSPLPSFLRYAIRQQEPPRARLDLAGSMRPTQGPARATLHLTDGEGRSEVWEVCEAWWAETFYPPDVDDLMNWGFRILGHQLTWVVEGLAQLRGPLRQGCRDPVYECDPDPTPASSRGYIIWWLTGKINYFAPAVIFSLLYVPAYFVVILLATLFYLLASLPSWLVVVTPAKAILRSLIDKLLTGVGDEYVMISNELARDSAVRSVLDGLSPYLGPQRPPNRLYDSVTIIAHSGGAVVSYAALSSDELKSWLKENGGYKPHITWFTVGSGLSFGWGTDRENRLWHQVLPEEINWVNVWARYDQVSHGPPDRRMVATLCGTSEAEGLPGNFYDIRVINRDSPFSDHGEYWRNFEQVMSRFVYAIVGQVPLPILPHAYDLPLQEIPRHKIGVAGMVFLRYVGAALAFVLGWWDGRAAALGTWTLERVEDVVPQPSWVWDAVDWLGTIWAGPFGLNAVLGMVVIGIGVYLVYRVLTLWMHAFLERGNDWD
jgi:hypothetical protein